MKGHSFNIQNKTVKLRMKEAQDNICSALFILSVFAIICCKFEIKIKIFDIPKFPRVTKF